jgi:alkylhydroperoxidase/carboxymuconolactone decarboxylase family protein YurZ
VARDAAGGAETDRSGSATAPHGPGALLVRWGYGSEERALVMSGRDDRRARARAMWREVMQAEPPPVTDPYTEVTTDHLMGQIWTRPGLARRDRRLVTLTIAAVTGQGGPLRNHLRASLESGDLSIEELHEWVVHLAHYGGWPAGTAAHAALGEISANSRSAGARRKSPRKPT